MSWLLNKLGNKPKIQTGKVPEDPVIIRYEVFKSHWFQLSAIINGPSKPDKFVRTNATVVSQNGDVSQDDVDAARNLLEQMIFLLTEEQTAGIALGPILEYVITNSIFNQLFNWTMRAVEHKKQLLVNQLKIYEVLVSQAEPSLLHHRQLVNPMWHTISEASDLGLEEVDGHIVIVLNLLCVWMNRYPTLLEVFFHSTKKQGAANFLMFSLLINYIHREGNVGQQARDALLLCMTLSQENEDVAEYIVNSSNFCPVLATGLSGLYSSLPRQMEVRADDWHCLSKQDWSHVPALVNFMNCLEFCNAVVEAAHELVSSQLLNYIYNGFLVSVFGPALHKISSDEVVVTTAYLNLFLRSVTAPALMKCFLRFLLLHRHDNSLIINTLIQRIGSNNRLALVSLSLFRTLLDLNCEDLMLHLIFRYLIPCNHLLTSQRRAVCDIDMYNASASRFLALTPKCCAKPEQQRNHLTINKQIQQESEMLRPIDQNAAQPSAEGSALSRNIKGDGETESSSMVDLISNSSSRSRTASESSIKAALDITPNSVSEFTVNEDLSVTINMHPADAVKSNNNPELITSPNTMAEFGSDLQSQIDLNTSYMDYLEDAKIAIDDCREACDSWSAPYNGMHPPPDSVQNEVYGHTTNTDPFHASTPVLSSQKNELTIRLHAQSDPLNTKTNFSSVNENFRTSTSEDPALQALNATYQALNLTAKAFEHSSNNSLLDNDHVNNSNGISEETKPNEPGSTTVNGININNTNKSQTNVNKEEKTIDLPNSEIIDNTHNTKKTNNLREDITDVDIENVVNEKSEDLSKATVDEFFKSLMESVPKSLVDKSKSDTKSKQIQDESEKNTEMNDKISENEMAEENGSNENKSVDDDEDVNDDIGSFHNSLEDEDWESSDNISFTSSSFYEPEVEYIPTEQSLSPATPIQLHGAPYTGPFLSTLFGKLEQMIGNSLYENLLLTGIVSRIACYTQPLLRSFLLNTHMVFHPSVRSLYQVLNSARLKIDLYSVKVDDFDVLLHRAQKYLLARGKIPLPGDAQGRSLIQEQPMPVPKVKTKNTKLVDVFMRRKNKVTKRKSGTGIAPLDTLLERGQQHLKPGSKYQEPSSSKFYIRQHEKTTRLEEKKATELRTKNAVYSSIVLTEFLKELAAISQEHAVSPHIWLR